MDRKLHTALKIDHTESPNTSSQNTPQLPDVNLRRQNSLNNQSPPLKNNQTVANNFMSPVQAKSSSLSVDTTQNGVHQPTPPQHANNIKAQPVQRHQQNLQRSKEIIHKPIKWEEYRMEVGLENLGNTCFMNSALQCLLHIKPLVEFFMKGSIEKDLNATSPKKGMLASSFLNLIYDVCNCKSGSAVAPSNFHRAVSHL